MLPAALELGGNTEAAPFLAWKARTEPQKEGPIMADRTSVVDGDPDIAVKPEARGKTKRKRHFVVNLAPELCDALAELAKVEDLPIGTLVALLINSGMSERLTRMPW
jgi:hypothetical protein